MTQHRSTTVLARGAMTVAALLTLAACGSGAQAGTAATSPAPPPTDLVARTAPATAAPSATTSAPRTAAMAQGTAAPTQAPAGTATDLTIAHPGEEPFITTPINAYTGPDDGVFNPGQAEVAWWAGDGFSAPAQSPISVLAGHVTFDGAPDVFYNLGQARAGDVITVSYTGGATSTWQVKEVVNAPKEEVASNQTEVGRKVWGTNGLRLITCDQSSGKRPDGHTVGNTVVLADRVG